VSTGSDALREGAADRRARFEAIAAEVFEPLQRYLRRRARHADAADVLGDVMLVIWRRLDDAPNEPLPWSYGIARRCLANQRRGSERHLRLVDKTAAAADSATTAPPADAPLDAADPDLESAIATLTPAEQETVRLWAWEQLEPREIATVLDTTANAVSVTLARIKRKLRDQLDRQDSARAGHITGTDANEEGTAE
jgi:RNA polymerase sigma-70 factor (ECF subfamily)